MKKVVCIISSILLLTTAGCSSRSYIVRMSIKSMAEKWAVMEISEEITISQTDVFEQSEDSQDNVDKESTKSKEELQEQLYKIAKEEYLSGKWDGTLTIIEGTEVSIYEKGGNLIVNGHVYDKVDLPENVEYANNFEYILGNGMYTLEGKKLVKYLRGEKIEIGSINYKGFNPNNPEEYGCTIDEDGYMHLPNSADGKFVFDYIPHLFYVIEADELILVTKDPVTDKQYLYKFPDYNLPKVELISEISDWYIWASAGYGFMEETFYYTDIEGNEWKYTEKGPMREVYLFED